MRMKALKLSLLTGLLVTTAAISGTYANDDGTINDKDMNIVEIQTLRYPPIAQTAHIQGVVVVKAKLDEQGNVIEAIALSGSALLLQVSVDNAKKLQFERNQQRAAIIVYNFRIAGTCPGDASSQMILYPPNFISVTACGLPAEP